MVPRKEARPMSAPTFDSLTTTDKATLDRIMLESPAPVLADVLGYELRGWNLNPAARLLGTLKFKKGFFGDPAKPYAWGYNVPVQQNEKAGPWIAQPSDADPRRYVFFKVFPADQARNPVYPKSLVIDYPAWVEHFALNPVALTVDYLVFPDPANRDLILGKSYLEAGPVRPFGGYFVIERHNPNRYGRTSHFLTERELRTVQAFAEVFIEGPGEVLTPVEITWNIERQLERID